MTINVERERECAQNSVEFFHSQTELMKVKANRRLSSTEESLAAIENMENSLNDIMKGIYCLHDLSAETGRKWVLESNRLKQEIERATRENQELQQLVLEKRERDLNEVTVLHQTRFEETLENMVHEQIEVPEMKIRLCWDHLKCRVDAAAGGGVIVTLGFPHSTRLNSLRFVLQYDGSYSVSQCDPMVIGLKAIVDNLNNDTRSGALARFCCRMRSTFMAQYSTESDFE